MSSTKLFTTNKLILTGMFTAIISVMSQIIIPIQPIPFSLSLMAIFLTGILLEPKYAFFATLAYILLGAFGLPVFAGLKGGIHILSGMTGGFIMAYPIMALVTSLFYRLSRRVKFTSYNDKDKSISLNNKAKLISFDNKDKSIPLNDKDKSISLNDKDKSTLSIERRNLSNSHKIKIAQLSITVLGMLISLFLCYLIGTLWFSYVSGSSIAYSLAVCVYPFIVFDLIKIALALTLGTVLVTELRL